MATILPVPGLTLTLCMTGHTLFAPTPSYSSLLQRLPV